MNFSDIIGQEGVKNIFLQYVKSGRIPHAIMLCGPTGSGKLPLAIAFANYICCDNHAYSDDSCGECPSCVKMKNLAHPDVHFAFPIVKRKSGRDSYCDEFLSQWREALIRNPYITPEEWTDALDAGNTQPIIYSSESDDIQRKLSLKSSQGGYKVMIIWMPEKMNPECANKILKILEEPPGQTLFMLVSENPDGLLPTIVSRVQRINLPPVDDEALAHYLESRYMLMPEDAMDIAHRSEGSVSTALENLRLSEKRQEFFDMFVRLMRLSYARDIRSLREWSDTLAQSGRENQKSFLAYCLNLVRENFMFNFHSSELVYLSPAERQFATRFAPFISEYNVIGIMQLLDEETALIEQNANAKIVFFDLALQMIVLIKQYK